MPGRRPLGAATLTILTHGWPAPIHSSWNALWSRTGTGAGSGTRRDESNRLGVSADHSRTSGRTFRSAAQSLSVPAGTTSALRRLSDLNGVPLPAIVVAAFQTLLHRYGAGDEIAVGVLLDEDFSGRLGSSSLPLAHASFADDPPFRELMARGWLEWSQSSRASAPSSDAAVSGGRADLCRVAAFFLVSVAARRRSGRRSDTTSPFRFPRRRTIFAAFSSTTPKSSMPPPWSVCGGTS